MKKYWFLWACGVIAAFFLGQECARANEACSQKLYDKIYRGIIEDTLNDKISIEVKNQRIEALRALCQGQKSSFEKQ